MTPTRRALLDRIDTIREDAGGDWNRRNPRWGYSVRGVEGIVDGTPLTEVDIGTLSDTALVGLFEIIIRRFYTWM